MAEPAAGVDPPRSERLTRWAIALDVAAVALVAGLAGNAAATQYQEPDENSSSSFLLGGAPLDDHRTGPRCSLFAEGMQALGQGLGPVHGAGERRPCAVLVVGMARAR